MQLTEIYEPLDPGIAPIVELLRSHGIDTFSSCEGGEGHVFAMPTVRLYPRSSMMVDEAEIARILSEAGYSGYYIKQYHPYQNGPTPWDCEDQHFLEIEFWSSPVEKEKNDD